MRSRRLIARGLVFLLLLPMLCGAAIKLPELKDIQRHWAEKYIIECAERGVASGFSDETFRPDSAVTRAEFIKMVVTAFSIKSRPDDAAKPLDFMDVPGHWAETYIKTAHAAGLVCGIDDTHFRPDRELIRQDAILILSRVEAYLGYSLAERPEDFPFLDEDYTREECAAAVAHFRRAGIIVGKTGNLFDPIGTMTRAEAAKCIILTIRSFETPSNSVN